MLLTLLAVTILPHAAGAGNVKAPATPVQQGISIMGGGTPCGTPGTWYLGATPPNVDYTKPVLLFVHGKGSCAETWWGTTSYHGTNDMYTYAYNNGYRTAFVDLYGDKMMWDNGALLNTLIDKVRNYFGVSKLTIVAHSKGGVDTNAALAHYGAAGKVSRVVTLGSPHYGTPLADYAYSTWTWWLAELFGARDDATYSMQTGYMNYFRSVTDGRDQTPFYTLSGYKCGPVFTAMWYSCAFIGGEDDGVVPVGSTRIPGGTHLKEGYWDHDEIKMGSRTWSYFMPVIRTADVPAAVAMGGLLAAAGTGPASDVAGIGMGKAAAPVSPGNLILRGGEVTGTAEAPALPIESRVRSATFTIYASHPDFSATITGPDGKAHAITMSGQVPADQVFGGTWTGHVTVNTPASGSWRLSAASSARAGYLMIAALDSDLEATLDVGQTVGTPGGKRALATGFRGGRTPASSRVEGVVKMSGEQQGENINFTPATGGHTANVNVQPARNGIYNASVTVTGTLPDGTAFERSLANSFAAVAPEQRGNWKGQN
jgi:pimeloyl-ACP methyl ester carboxylesterase